MRFFLALISCLLAGVALAAEPNRDDLILKRLEELQQSLNRLQTLDARLKELEARVKSLEERPATPKPRPKIIEGSAPDSSSYGEVKFINTFSRPVNVYLNGIHYRLDAGETKQCSIPAGTFTYRIQESNQGTLTRSVKAEDTFTISISARNGGGLSP
jgi:hypothetical protein